MFTKLRKIRNCLTGVFHLTLKNIDSSTPTSETIENANMFTLEYAFTYGSGKSNFEEKISTTVNQKKKKRKSKVHQRIMS